MSMIFARIIPLVPRAITNGSTLIASEIRLGLRGQFRIGHGCSRHLSTYDETKSRQYLQSHSGGIVEFSKDDDEDGLAIITLKQEDKGNPLTGKMMVDLSDIIDELEHWQEGKAVLLRGAGGNFCSGGDLQFLNRIMNRTGGAIMCQFMQTTLTRLLQLPLISVALVEGQALGGGAELTTACDYRLITPDTRIGFVHGRMGVTPGWGGASRLLELVGSRAALDMLLTARPIRADQALAIRLADDVVSTEDAYVEAKAWIAQRTSAHCELVRAMKRLAVLTINRDNLQREKDIFCEFWGAEGHIEAMKKGMKHR